MVETIWTIYWIGFVLSVTGWWMRVAAVGLDRDEHLPALTLGTVLSLAWPIMLPIVGVYGAIHAKPKLSAIKSLYPDARRERKRKLMAERVHREFSERIKAIEESSEKETREGAAKLLEKQRENAELHAEWLSETGMDWVDDDLVVSKLPDSRPQARWGGKRGIAHEITEIMNAAGEVCAVYEEPSRVEPCNLQPIINPGTLEVLNWSKLPVIARQSMLRAGVAWKSHDGRAYSKGYGNINVDYDS